MAKMVLKSTEEINHGRKRTRLIFTLAIIPFLLVALVMGWKITSMYWKTSVAIEKADTAQSQDVSESEKKELIDETLKLIEGMDTEVFADRWIVSYNYGSTLLIKGDYLEASKKLKQSILEIDPDKPEICLIYAQLAIAYEKMGDKAANESKPEEAEQQYNESLLVIEAAAAKCSPPPEDNTSNNEDNQESSEPESPDQKGSESLAKTKERVIGKQQKLNDQKESSDSSTEDPNTPNASTPGQDDLDKIRDKMDKSSDDKSGQDSGSGSGGGWDKPW